MPVVSAYFVSYSIRRQLPTLLFIQNHIFSKHTRAVSTCVVDHTTRTTHCPNGRRRQRRRRRTLLFTFLYSEDPINTASSAQTAHTSGTSPRGHLTQTVNRLLPPCKYLRTPFIQTNNAMRIYIKITQASN